MLLYDQTQHVISYNGELWKLPRQAHKMRKLLSAFFSDSSLSVSRFDLFEALHGVGRYGYDHLKKSLRDEMQKSCDDAITRLRAKMRQHFPVKREWIIHDRRTDRWYLQSPSQSSLCRSRLLQQTTLDIEAGRQGRKTESNS